MSKQDDDESALDVSLCSAVNRLVDLRRHLIANRPGCLCGETEQIQLVDHIWHNPAQWRCRVCGRTFYFSPNTRDDRRRATDSAQPNGA